MTYLITFLIAVFGILRGSLSLCFLALVLAYLEIGRLPDMADLLNALIIGLF